MARRARRARLQTAGFGTRAAPVTSAARVAETSKPGAKSSNHSDQLSVHSSAAQSPFAFY
eukprot:2341202-Heterocapsa_arctica.AAC.1